MDTDLGWIDLVRFLTCVAAILLALLVARLAWLRWPQRATDDRPSTLVYASYASALLLGSALRIPHVGHPPTWDLWAFIAIVTMGWFGVMKRTRIKPPWKR